MSVSVRVSVRVRVIITRLDRCSREQEPRVALDVVVEALREHRVERLDSVTFIYREEGPLEPREKGGWRWAPSYEVTRTSNLGTSLETGLAPLAWSPL